MLTTIKDYTFAFIVMLLLVFATGVKAQDPLPANKDYTDFNHCFDFSEFAEPENVDYDLLSVLCSFIEISGVGYVHHSDVRPLERYEAIGMWDGYEELHAKSLHKTGDALDFHFKIPAGRDPIIYFREQFFALYYFILGNKLYEYGIGLYYWGLDRWSLHLDNGRGMKPNRRWALLEGQTVSIGMAMDELIRQARAGL